MHSIAFMPLLTALVTEKRVADCALRHAGDALADSQRLGSWPNGGQALNRTGVTALPPSYGPASHVPLSSRGGSMASVQSAVTGEIEPAPLGA